MSKFSGLKRLHKSAHTIAIKIHSVENGIEKDHGKKVSLLISFSRVDCSPRIVVMDERRGNLGFMKLEVFWEMDIDVLIDHIYNEIVIKGLSDSSL